MSSNIHESDVSYHRVAMITHEQIIKDNKNRGIVRRILPNRYVRSIFLGLILALLAGLVLLPAVMHL